MKRIRKGLALLLSVLLLMELLPFFAMATETATDPTTEPTLETTTETVPETTAAAETVPETTVPATTAPEKVTVSCSAGYMSDGEFIPNRDIVSAEGYGLQSITALWADGYDDLLTDLYGASDLFSPYALTVVGYVPGDAITIYVEMSADYLLQENVLVYYINENGGAEPITGFSVNEVQHEEEPFTQIVFTVDHLGIFAVGNQAEAENPAPEETVPPTTEETVPPTEETVPPSTEETVPPSTEETVPPADEPVFQVYSDDQVTIYAAAVGLTAVTAVDQKASANTGNTFTDYICYTITPEGNGEGDTVFYGITVPESFDSDNLALYQVTPDGLFAMDFTVEGDMVTFQHPGELTVACGVAAVPEGCELTGIELSGNLPANCFLGDSIILSDVKVTAVYSSGEEEFRKVLHPASSVEEDGYLVTADTGAVGETTVYVTYGTASATFTVTVHQENFEDAQTGIRVEVDAFGTTEVSVEVLDSALFDQSPLVQYLDHFVAYDIDLTGYQQGDFATVTLPIPEGVENPAVYYVSDDGAEIVRMSSTNNGDGTITFRTNHFSTYAVGNEGITGETTSDTTTMPGTTLDKVTVTVPPAVETGWKLTNTLTNGKKYLIVNANTAGSGNALINGNTAGTAVEIKYDAINGYYIILDNSSAEWTASQSDSSWALSNNGTYVGWNSTTSGTFGGTKYTNVFAFSTSRQDWQLGDDYLTVNLQTYDPWYGNNSFSDYYLAYYNSAWTMAVADELDSTKVYFYVEDEIIRRVVATYSVDITVDNTPKQAHSVSTMTQTLQLGAALNSSDSGQLPSGGSYTWEAVSNNGIATVNDSGLVTFTGTSGTEAFKVSYTWTEGNTSCTISNYIVLTVTDPVYTLDLCQPKKDADGNIVTDENGNTIFESITVPIVKKDIQKGSTDNLWAVITANGEDIGQLSEDELSKLSFVSSNTDIATVDLKTGVVTFQGGEGTVVITAIYEYAEGQSVTDTVVFSVSADHYVVPEDGTTDFPEYPNEGSIRFDKHAVAVGNFSETGVVQVELSMTGVPFTSGSEIDVVIMLDMSNSMNQNGVDRKTPAIAAAQQALEILVKNEDGTYNGNRVAIYGFNGWNSSSYGSTRMEAVYEYDTDNAYSGTSNDNISRIAPMQSYSDSNYQTTIDNIKSQYELDLGTNYAAALKQCYLTLANTRQEGRRQFVIFMTDGAASTGFAYVNNSGEKALYNINTLGEKGFDSIATVALETEWYSTQMKNAGVEIYTVGVQIKGNNDTETTNAHQVLQKIAGTKDGNATQSGFEKYALTVDEDPSGLKDVFGQIATAIKQAATDVKVSDEISGAFTMVFDPPNAAVDSKDGGQDYYIEVKEYALEAVKDGNGNITDYLRGDATSLIKLYMGVNNGTYYAATAANSTGGNNKFDTPSFAENPLGTLYYWTTVEANGDSGISVKGADGNTYYFTSAGNGTHNMVSGAYAYGKIKETYITDENGNATSEVNKTSEDLIIATPYFVYNAQTRMLVWTAEKLSSTELALSYFLYLDESGGYDDSIHKLPAGTYETNAEAKLTYTNFQDNACEVIMPVPQITWSGAQLSYVFYLVNEDGQPVNRAGRVVPFSEAVYVTDVFTYSITWNDLETMGSLEADRLAAELVPDVYQLYDEGASYRIHVYEDEDASSLNNHFRITRGDDTSVNTTYVYNTKSDAVKYTAPGVYSTNQTFLCKGENPVTYTEENGTITSASYTPLSGETQKKFDEMPHGAAFFDATRGYAYYIDKDEDGQEYLYTIVEKNIATAVEPGFDFSNTTVAFAVMWKPQLETDTVVIDFGLDVVVEVAINDALASGVVGVLSDPPKDYVINNGAYLDRQSTDDPIDLNVLIDGEKVKVGMAYADSQNSVRVALDKRTGMLVKEPLVFYYESQVNYYSSNSENYATDTLNTYMMYSSVTVIPATTIYYEDEYVQLSSETKESGSWAPLDGGSGWDVDSKAATDIQSNDRPGESKVSELYDADNLYGYDPAYSDCSTYSLDHSAKFTATTEKRGIASFEFYGTGFDVIGVTGNTTGTIIVKLYPWENGAYSSKAQLSYVVDTFYGYTYKGTDPETGEPIWEVNANDPSALYQVPVMKVANQPYGRYKAEILIRYSPAFDHTDSGAYEFYMDAIRIYDPAGDDPTDETIKDAYEKDGESFPMYAELRNFLIDAGTFDSFTGDSVSGAVFIDGVGTEASVSDYTNFGPNNELYLANGQAVSFHLDAANAKTIQMAMKSVGSGAAQAKIWYFENGVEKQLDTYTLNTATDMYFDITALMGKDVVIRNEGDSILSITNIKMTFASKADRPDSLDAAQVMSVNREGTAAVLMLLRRPPVVLPPIPEVPETTPPETTEPEVTEPETTEPETTEPETTEPETTEPETTEPETTEPETTEPETTEPETTEPEITEPETTEPETTEPETTEPETTEPEVTEPEVTEPETTEPETTEPETTEPETTEPDTTEPETTEPETTEPETTEPETTEPETTEPETTEPETTEPETTEPETTEPETTEPETTEPETTEPETTEPETTEPETTEPEVTEPETTEPVVTEPEATVPKNPASPPAGNPPADTQPPESTPTEPETTVPEDTSGTTEPSSEPETAVTEEPEPELPLPSAGEPLDDSEQQKPIWELILDWIAELINFIMSLFSEWF